MAWLLAWRQFKSHWHAGELRVLMLALVLAVGSVSAVGFFVERVASALTQQGGQLLGGDLVVGAHQAIPTTLEQQAQQYHLQTVTSMEFPSMVLHGELGQLAEIKAVGQGFPLRGNLTISHADGQLQVVNHAPQAGTVWIESKLATALNVQVGGLLQVGETQLKVVAILSQEPSRGGDMFSFAPRLMMHLADIQATKLIQYGSRVKYQLLLAGKSHDIQRFASWVKPQLTNGERVEDVSQARPEVKSALEKSQQFLGLSAMVSVILSVVAICLASIPYIANCFNNFALLRCLGASKRLIMHVMLLEALYLSVIAGVLGVVLGVIAQQLLAVMLGHLLLEQLPAFSLSSMPYKPILTGIILSVVTMLAMLWPYLKPLSNVPAMHVLRAENVQPQSHMLFRLWPLFMVLIGMIFWQAHHIKLAISVIVGLMVLVILIAGLTWLVLQGLGRLPKGNTSSMQLGLAGLKRRPILAIAQSIGLSLGLMALILLAFIRSDLMQNWQQSLPADAPNRFVINIQPEQIASIKQFFSHAQIDNTSIYPMIRGRLVAVNNRPFNADQFQDERARKLAEREFNLSIAKQMQSDNQLIAGRWWSESEFSKPFVSIEQGLAETLGLKMGDALTYDIAGTRITLSITSLRKVDWDTMRANFFAVTPPKVLENFSASYITSFYLPPSQEDIMQALVKQHPNLTVIDVAALMQQVRTIMQKMTNAIQFVFIFSLLSGLAVLYAALVATREARVKEATLLRVLGAKQWQVMMAAVTEFSAIGVLAALPAVIAANILAYYVSVQVLNIPYTLNWQHTVLAVLLAIIAVPAASWLVLRGYLNQPPRQILQSI